MTTGVVNHDAIINSLDTISDIEENIKQSLSGTRTYRYYKYNSTDVKQLCGEMRKKEVRVELLEEKGDSIIPDYLMWQLGSRAPKRRKITQGITEGKIVRASQLNCTGIFLNFCGLRNQPQPFYVG